MKKGIIIAIDGPVAAGKGTISPMLVKRLNAFYLYTGGMYRCLALASLWERINIDSEEEVLKVLESMEVKLDGEKVFLEGEDVTRELKNINVVEAVAHCSLHPKVREFMVKKQREIGEKEANLGRVVVVEGRDAGTKIFPEADFKLFLTASQEIRAKRRLVQIQEAGNTPSYEEVLRGLKERDRLDMERSASPLPSDPKSFGYFVLDNTELSEVETIDAIIEEIKRKGLINDTN